jgi:hypothetical protein
MLRATKEANLAGPRVKGAIRYSQLGLGTPHYYRAHDHTGGVQRDAA